MANPSVWTGHHDNTFVSDSKLWTITRAKREGGPNLACHPEATEHDANPAYYFVCLESAPSEKRWIREIGKDCSKVEERNHSERCGEPRRFGSVARFRLFGLFA